MEFSVDKADDLNVKCKFGEFLIGALIQSIHLHDYFTHLRGFLLLLGFVSEFKFGRFEHTFIIRQQAAGNSHRTTADISIEHSIVTASRSSIQSVSTKKCFTWRSMRFVTEANTEKKSFRKLFMYWSIPNNKPGTEFVQTNLCIFHSWMLKIES